eukprot:7984444-Alexandrium_andersonii.AAC.1
MMFRAAGRLGPQPLLYGLWAPPRLFLITRPGEALRSSMGSCSFSRVHRSTPFFALTPNLATKGAVNRAFRGVRMEVPGVPRGSEGFPWESQGFRGVPRGSEGVPRVFRG